MIRVDKVRTGRNISRAMEDHGVRASDIMEACGLTTRNAIYRWMNGKSLPTIDHMVILAYMVETALQDLIAIEDI